MSFTNLENDPSRMLVLMAAPSLNDPFYANYFNDLVDFQVDLINSIVTASDNVVIVVDLDTVKYYSGRIADDCILVDTLDDIWIRDYGLVNPVRPTRFVYTPAAASKNETKRVQNSYDDFIDYYNLSSECSDLYLDGGNVVDNYSGGFVTTTRFVGDNLFDSVSAAKDSLADEFKSVQIAVIPPDPDDSIVAHAENMVMWLDAGTLLVNDYTGYARNMRGRVLQELKETFPYVNVVEVPFKTVQSAGHGGLSTAAGINVNALVTLKNVYVPVYGMSHEDAFLCKLKSLTDKLVLAVDGNGVAPIGASVRSLTSQLMGENARKLIQAARCPK
jgi:agmatine/peptidylarginine deiminase